MAPFAFGIAANDVRLDLFGDWRRIMERVLTNWGHTVPPTASLQDVCIQFFNLDHRLVSSVPRSVEISQEFICPPDLQHGLNIVRKKIEDGEDLTPHLSKGILRDGLDGLLNDWGINHLHLGTELMDDGRFMKRTGPVLFVRFTRDTAYFIGVAEHGNWTNQELMRILHRNWPESIERYRMDIGGLGQNVTDADFQALRGNPRRGQGGHVQSFVEVEPGAVYFPLGMGYATDGTSLAVTMKVDDCLVNLRRYEEHVKQNLHVFLNEVRSKTESLPTKLSFIMGTDFTTVSVFEVYSKILFRLGPLLR